MTQIASAGFEIIRLTYADEKVNQIYARNGSDVPLEVAMINGLGYENGTRLTKEIVAHNPGWTKDTTRFEIWGNIAQTAASKQIYIHPDMHVGKAQWCCNNTDGNAWFNDYDFPVDVWKRGLKYMANWAQGHDDVLSMSLRNELRRAINITSPTSTIDYDWLSLVGDDAAATDAIYETNSDILVTWSSM
ncbi:glycoside hydrolase family 5 protein [Dothistroma septosporum NZE10]|uniref:Glycoside hydrolase family 5 protein n=1 Tax=Dothistroma septosporum (strain NZE10 / CBS 128990) TaxID=675120 RepID=N1PQM3_DOTSN|nr:glycoside hydrolase family 5 protein [Dothistroma septosporum NZE10]